MSATQSGAVFFAPISIATATTTDLVAAVANKSITVINACFTLSGAGATALFRDDTPTNLTGAMDAAGVYAFNGRRDAPLFSTGKGKKLQVVTAGTPVMRGFIAYILEEGP